MSSKHFSHPGLLSLFVLLLSVVLQSARVINAQSNFSVSVVANTPWQGTGIQVAAGQLVRFSATGLWSHGFEGAGTGQNPYDADGYQTKFDSTALLPSSTVGALIGRVGDSNPFFVGTANTIVAPASGSIELSINDTPGLFAADNTGQQTVTISLLSGSNPNNDPAIARELEAGIVRLFDDGVVITRQANGDIEYYLPNGCLIGSTARSVLVNTNLYLAGLIQTISGCNGYSVHIRSLGFAACQIQMNIYGPNGYEKVYRLPPNDSEAERLVAGCTRLPREVEQEVNTSQQSEIVASPLWREQLRILARETGQELVGIVARTRNLGDAWQGLTLSINIWNIGETGEVFFDPALRAQLIDELYFCTSSSPTFRASINQGVTLSGIGYTWEGLTLDQKRSDPVWENIVIFRGGSAFVGPQFMRKWLGASGCVS